MIGIDAPSHTCLASRGYKLALQMASQYNTYRTCQLVLLLPLPAFIRRFACNINRYRFSTHIFQQPPSSRQTATCSRRTSTVHERANGGREQECCKEPVPEDAHWAFRASSRYVFRSNSQSERTASTISCSFDLQRRNIKCFLPRSEDQDQHISG